MRVALYDIDSKIPNLGLMRLSAFHKAQGDEVEMYLPLAHETYDRVYASSIFDFSDKSYVRDDMIIGGTGFDLNKTLPPEVERLDPDYSLYDYPHNIGFAMRGCRFRCDFCVVPRKEGRAHKSKNISDLITNATGSRKLVLLDNDFFGGAWEESIQEILKLDLEVNFNQGINARILSERQAQALSKVKFRNLNFTDKKITVAWDNINEEKTFFRGVHRLMNAGIKPRYIQSYVLIGFDSTESEDLYRVNKLKDYGIDPYAMPFDKKDTYQRRFTRWVNNKIIFKTCEWSEYTTKHFS